MKKIILTLVFLMCTVTVYASNSNETFWSEQELEEGDYELLTTVRKYQWYQEEYQESLEYYLRGTNPDCYPYLKTDDYQETEWSNWDHNNYPVAHSDRIIEKRTVNKYRELKPIRYIIINNVKGGYLYFYIAELKILINNQEHLYTIECTSCSDNFYNNITNGIVNENKAYLYNGGQLIIDLGAFYGVNEVKIELYMADQTVSPKRCDIHFSELPTITNNIYHHFITYVVSPSTIMAERYLISADQNWIINPIYKDWVYIDHMVNATYYRQMVVATEMRYRDLKYRYYNIERNYLEGYYDELVGGYIKDETLYQDYYLYQPLITEQELITDIEEEELGFEVEIEEVVTERVLGSELVSKEELEIPVPSLLKPEVTKENKVSVIPKVLKEPEVDKCPLLITKANLEVKEPKQVVVPTPIKAKPESVLFPEKLKIIMALCLLLILMKIIYKKMSVV